MSDTVKVEFLGEQVKRLLNETAEFRDQLTVLTAICMRVEAAVNAFAIEVRAMHSRHNRLSTRVDTIETLTDATITKLDRIIAMLEAR